jgi:ubiquinone/menaquinone biosynthesis C-methylase UbiE
MNAVFREGEGTEIIGTPGEIYERHMVPAIFSRWAPELVAAAGVKAGERVLDLACGTGAVTRVVADTVGPSGRVVGLDLSAAMLVRAQASAAASTVANHVEWMEGDAAALSLPDASFDAVVCQQGFQFFPDKAAALREMRRVLLPGGRLALAVWRSVEHAPGFRVLQEALARHVAPGKAVLPPFACGDAAAIRALVSDAGFDNVRVRAEVKMARFPSAENFVRCVVGGAPTMIGAIAEQGPEVFEEIVKEVVEVTRNYTDDEGWATSHATNIITATRPA